MTPEELFDDCLEGTVYRDKQVDAHGVHLTARDVRRLDAAGRIDFGGSELAPCATQAIQPQKAGPDDEYGWWRLEGGTYLVVFNERLKEGAPPTLLTPNARLLSCGCSVAPLVCRPGELRSLLTVPS
ncbi:MAG: hypothetical protein AMK73_05415, partial [Planctomycetes bacterium SM23_32]